MTFHEVLCLRTCSENRVMNKLVLMYDDFRFIYISELVGKSLPKSSFLFTIVNIGTGGRN